jgi:hypothetical protein
MVRVQAHREGVQQRGLLEAHVIGQLLQAALSTARCC